MKVLFLIFFALAAVDTYAQSPHVASFSRTFTLSTVLDITKTTSGTLYNFSTIADHENGIVKDYQIIVKANKPWSITVSSSTPNFSGNTNTTMPVSVAGIKRSFETNFNQSLPFVFSGNTGITTQTLNVKLNPGYTYEAGDYIVDVYFVITAP